MEQTAWHTIYMRIWDKLASLADDTITTTNSNIFILYVNYNL